MRLILLVLMSAVILMGGFVAFRFANRPPFSNDFLLFGWGPKMKIGLGNDVTAFVDLPEQVMLCSPMSEIDGRKNASAVEWVPIEKEGMLLKIQNMTTQAVKVIAWKPKCLIVLAHDGSAKYVSLPPGHFPPLETDTLDLIAARR